MKTLIALIVTFISVTTIACVTLLFDLSKTVYEIKKHTRDIAECKDVLKFLERKHLYRHEVFIPCDECGGWVEIVESRFKDVYMAKEITTIMSDGREVCSKCVVELQRP